MSPSRRPTTREKYGGQAQPPRAQRTDNRKSAAKRGYGRHHRRWRRMVLHRYPVCNMCNRAPATVADHIVPWQDGGDKYALANGQGLCAPCHNAKTHEDVQRRKNSELPTASMNGNLHVPIGRIAIGGPCKSGKTTLAHQLQQKLDIPLRHTDEVIGQGPTHSDDWGAITAEWFDAPGPWIIEGVRIAHALRYRMLNDLPPNVDTVIWGDTARVPLTTDQQRMNQRLARIRWQITDYLTEHDAMQLAMAG